MDKCVSWYNIVSGYAILGVCPSGWGCNYRLKVSNTMSNTDAQIPDSYIAVGYGYSLERIHELALEEDLIRKYNVVTIESLLFSLAQAQIDRDTLELKARKEVDAGDYRVRHLWEKLYAALDGDIEQDETWGLIVDEIPGVPDLRVKTWEVEIPLDAITVEVEAKDEDEAIERGMQKAEDEYSLGDVIQERYVEAREV